MLEFLKDILIIFARIVTILPLLLFITLFMGKRAIGEIPVFDFLIVIILGALVGADIADPDIKHLPTAIAIVFIGIFQRVVANLKISNRKIGKLLTLEPTVVIQNGKFIHKNLKQIRYTIDNVIQMLREKDVFDMNEVETAIIEPNGTLSVLKKPEKNVVTREDLNIVNTTSCIALPVVVEGTIYTDVLSDFNVSKAWLIQQLQYQNINDVNDVFFASINRNLELHVCLKNEIIMDIPTIKH